MPRAGLPGTPGSRHLARQYRVVRPDMRGFGQSTPMPRDYPWTLDRLVEDFCLLMDHLGIDRFHLVGAKIGGTIARAFAARRPERVKTLTVVGTPPPLRPGAAAARAGADRDVRDARRRVLGAAEHGQPARQRLSAGRLRILVQVHGPHRGLDPARLHGRRSPAPTSAPTCRRSPARRSVITTEESGLGSVDETRAWQQQIPDSELVVLPGNSYHVAATHADQSAQATLDFIARRGG